MHVMHLLFMLFSLGALGMATMPMAAAALKNRHPFWQSGQTVIGANATAKFQINIDDHAFNGLQLMATSTGAFLTKLTVGGRSFSSDAVHSANMWGTASLPFNLALPMTFPQGTVVQVEMTDLTGAQNTVNWAMHGYQYDAA